MERRITTLREINASNISLQEKVERAVVNGEPQAPKTTVVLSVNQSRFNSLAEALSVLREIVAAIEGLG